MKRFPFVGETIKGLKFETGFGGKGANKAVACSRLGSKVAVISMVFHLNFRMKLANH